MLMMIIECVLIELHIYTHVDLSLAQKIPQTKNVKRPWNCNAMIFCLMCPFKKSEIPVSGYLILFLSCGSGAMVHGRSWNIQTLGLKLNTYQLGHWYPLYMLQFQSSVNLGDYTQQNSTYFGFIFDVYSRLSGHPNNSC